MTLTTDKLFRFQTSTVTFVLSILFAISSVCGQTTKQTTHCFDKDKPFEILTAVKGTTDQSSDPNTTQCKAWTIPQNNISTVIKDSKVIAGNKWHDDFAVYPCIISGQLTQDGQTYKYEINSGAWLYIYCTKQTLILGYYKKDYKKYFMSGAWDGK